MIAGIPGTGIGGIYYILLALLMPVHEACVTCRGRSSWRRWGDVSLQVVHAVGILAAIYGTGWLLAQAINFFRLSFLDPAHSAVYQRLTNIVATAGAYMAVATLGTVLLVVYTLRLFIRAPQRAR